LADVFICAKFQQNQLKGYRATVAILSDLKYCPYTITRYTVTIDACLKSC